MTNENKHNPPCPFAENVLVSGGTSCTCPAFLCTQEEMVKEDWEKKYCKTFGLCIEDCKYKCQCREEKTFIRNLLTARDNYLKKELEGEKKNERNMAKGEIVLETVGEVEAWNFALSTVTARIDEMINKLKV